MGKNWRKAKNEDYAFSSIVDHLFECHKTTASEAGTHNLDRLDNILSKRRCPLQDRHGK